MNTEMEIILESDREQDFSETFENVQLLFAQVEQTASRFLPNSELVEFNRLEGDIPVSPMLFQLLTAARQAFDETGGIFNPALLSELEDAGYDVSMERWSDERKLPDSRNSRFPLPAAEKAFSKEFADVPYEVVDTAKHIIRKRQGVRIDLGGIAKGWTADRAAELLFPLGAGLMNAGGDIRVFGNREKPWIVGVEDPHAPDRDLGVLQVQTGAVATSSTWKRRWQNGGRWQHHLLDPTTGRPSETELVSVTVTAPTAVQADVWAKTVLLLGSDKGASWIRERNQYALLVDLNQQVRSV
jgi:thiamine biosynthesis lipoprotein